MLTFIFDKVNRIIEIAIPDTDVTVQQLINAIRDWEDELVNLEVPKVADASGKEDLGGGLQVGITLKLFNWRLKFEDRVGPDWADCSVTGGNLVAVNGTGQPMNPIQPSAYVTVTVVKAVSAAMVQDVDIDAIRAKVELLPTEAALATAHGEGSWEGATPPQMWDHDDRRLTSVDIESETPGEALPSKEELLTETADIKKKIDEIKVGRGFRI